MPETSKAHKLGAWMATAYQTARAGKAAPVVRAARYQRPGRVAGAAWHGARTTWRSFARVLHLLWLQTTGLFFLLFAVAGATAAIRQYHSWQASHTGAFKVCLAAGFAALFAWFGVSSFWRANRAEKRAAASPH